MRSSVSILAVLLAGLPAFATPGLAASCSAKGDGFGAWLAGYAKTLADAGLPADAVRSSLSGVASISSRVSP